MCFSIFFSKIPTPIVHMSMGILEIQQCLCELARRLVLHARWNSLCQRLEEKAHIHRRFRNSFSGRNCILHTVFLRHFKPIFFYFSTVKTSFCKMFKKIFSEIGGTVAKNVNNNNKHIKFYHLFHIFVPCPLTACC